jgi:hypothetical protein
MLESAQKDTGDEDRDREEPSTSGRDCTCCGEREHKQEQTGRDPRYEQFGIGV